MTIAVLEIGINLASEVVLYKIPDLSTELKFIFYQATTCASMLIYPTIMISLS